jgi:hypothetical protein
MENIESRLQKNLTPEPMTGCHLWVGYADKDGYGKIYWNKRHRRAHTVVFELAKGPIPKGYLIQHTCDTPSCANLAHLRLGTPLSNMQDKVKKGRLKNQNMGKTHCKHGHEYSVTGFYTYMYAGYTGPRRRCRECHLIRMRNKSRQRQEAKIKR